MHTMRFETQQPQVTIYDLGDGKEDVVICANETAATETYTTMDGGTEEEQERTVYDYDGNIFRTVKGLTEDDITGDIDYYLDYEGDTEPTQEMIDYATEQIDEYTAQLVEEGLL